MVAKLQVGQTAATKAALQGGYSKAAVKTSTANIFVPTSLPVTGAQLNAWALANGGWHTIKCVPLPNVQLATKYVQQGSGKAPLPYGYTGKPTGVRATYQNYYLFGMQTPNGVTRNLPAIHAKMQKTDGHSLKVLLCLAAMFNGGYGKTANGKAYVQLVATGKAVK